CVDYKIRLWDESSDRGTRLELAGHGTDGVRVRYSPSGDRLLSTDWSQLWMLWDARTGQRLLTMPASWNAIQFSSDGRRLAAGVAGRTLRLFRYAEGTEYRSFRGLA